MRSLLLSATMMFALAACGKPADDAAPADSATPAETAAPADSATPAETAAPAPEAATPAAPATTTVNANAAGAAVFKKCVSCHTIDKGGRNMVGPNLWGIVGRPVASHEGFAYSAAMKAKGGVWDDASLDAYLTAPMRAVPGTKMSFAGLADAADRAALIAYLKAQAD